MSCYSTVWALQSSDGIYHKLTEPNFFVGREDALDLILKSRSVDKRHAVITADAAKQLYQLHDLGSLNGTFVNEIRVRQRPVTLKLRDTVRFGYDVNTFRVEICPEERILQHSSLTSSNRSCVDVNHNNHNGLGGLWHDDRQSTPGNQVPVSSYADTSANQYTTSHHIVSHQSHPVHPDHRPYAPHSYSSSPPTFHHPPAFHNPSSPSRPSPCSCPSCGHRSSYYPHDYEYHPPNPGYHGYQHYPHSFGHGIVSIKPKLIQRPLSVHGDRYDTIIKGSPLYGQPPWWGWGSSDEEVYSYPNTSTMVARGEGASDLATQHMITLQKKKQLTKPKCEQNTHSVGSVSMVSKSKTARIGRTVREQAEYLIVKRKSSSTSGRISSDSLSPVSENNSTADWELVDSDQWRPGRELRLEEFDSRTFEQLRLSTSFEVPNVPDFKELPEKPVSVKKTKEKGISDENNELKKNDNEKKSKKLASKLKRRSEPHVAKKSNKGSVARRHSGTSVTTDTTESDADSVHGHPDRRTVAPPPVNVFGLTEVKMEGSKSMEPQLSPTPGMPSWVQEWARADGRSTTSFDSTGGRTADSSSLMSSFTSTAGSSSPQDGNFTEPKSRSDKRSSQPPSSTRPRSSPASGRTRSSPPGIGRSHSVASTMISRQSTSKSNLARRSHTIAASWSRTTVHSKSSHRSGSIHSQDSQGSQRSLASSTSGDESDVESSDQMKQNSTRRKRSSDEKRDSPHAADLLRGKSPNRASPAPRGNKATMLRAEAVKGIKTTTRSDKNKSGKSKTLPSGLKKTPKGADSVEDHTSHSADNLKGSCDGEAKEDDVEKTVDEIFNSGRSPVIPESFKMDRNNKLNRTFVLEEGKSLSPSSSPDCTPSKTWPEQTGNGSETGDCNRGDSCLSPGIELPVVLPASTTPQGRVLSPSSPPKAVPFAPVQSSVPYVPSTDNIKPFSPPRMSPDSKPIGQLSPRGRPVSPDSLVSVPPSSSPPPPTSPREEALKKLHSLERRISSSSQARRTWDVTDKPVENLMLSSIHAFTVELRLASESTLSKVKKLYEGENKEGETKEETALQPWDKNGHESVIPDWKSSHAEIAGIFRNLRKVELRLRTMDQALSTLCKDDDTSTAETKKPLDANTSRLNGQKWKDFKKRARKSSWAVEHKSQFPDGAESDDDEEDDT